MRKLSFLSVCVVACCLLCATGNAAIITLKSGERLNGFVVNELPDRLVLRINGADVDVMNDDIVAIEFGEPAKQQDLYQQALKGTSLQVSQKAPADEISVASLTGGSQDTSIRDRNDPMQKIDEQDEKRKQADYEKQIHERDQFSHDMVTFFDDLGYDTKELKTAIQKPDFWDKKR